jgi:hypothetical protein
MYLTDALKNEIMILRRDLKKSGLTYHLITDKKVLTFLPNNAVAGNEDDQTEQTTEVVANPLEPSPTKQVENNEHQSEVSKTDSESSKKTTKGNSTLRRRDSILHLDEEELIMKYCELKAKYENLFSSAGEKIHRLSIVPENFPKFTEPEKNDELDKLYADSSQKLERTLKEHALIEEELNRKITLLTHEKLILIEEKEGLTQEYDNANELLNLNVADIKNLTDKISKKSINNLFKID